MSDSRFLLATLYRTVYAILGSYVTARLAPDRPMQHALLGGAIGLVLATVGAAATWNKGPEFGPHWYPLALVATALPCAWAGGESGRGSAGHEEHGNAAGHDALGPGGPAHAALRRPAPLVFDAFTKPELLKRWLFGPDGWSLAVCEIDFRVGGKYRYVWKHLANGKEMGMGGVIREIVVPERLVSTEKFDEAWYPGEGAVGTVVLTEQGKQTLLTQTIRYGSKEARDAALKTGMKDGMGAGYERLEGVFAETRQ